VEQQGLVVVDEERVEAEAVGPTSATKVEER